MTTTVDHFALRTLLTFLEKECRVAATELAQSTGLSYDDYKNYRNFRSGSASRADTKFAKVLNSIRPLCLANLAQIESSHVAHYAFECLFPAASVSTGNQFLFDKQMAELAHPSLVDRFLQLYSGLWWTLRPGSGLDDKKRAKTFNLSMLTVSPTIMPGLRAPRVKYYYRHGGTAAGMENTYESFVCSAGVQLQWVEVLGVREFGTDLLRICWPFYKTVVGNTRVNTFYGLGQMHNSDLKPVASRMWFVFGGAAHSHEELEELKETLRRDVRLGSYSIEELEHDSAAMTFLEPYRAKMQPILASLGTVIDAYRIGGVETR